MAAMRSASIIPLHLTARVSPLKPRSFRQNNEEYQIAALDDEYRRSLASDKFTLLRRHPLFGAVGPELLDRLSSYAIMRSVHRGHTIFVKGDPGNSLYALCAGTVKISVPSTEGKDAVFNLIGANEIFGEIALIDGQPRTADA